MNSSNSNSLARIGVDAFNAYYVLFSFLYWLFLIPIDLIVVRYFKTKNFWLRNHKNMHRIFGIIILFFEVCFQILDYDDSEDSFLIELKKQLSNLILAGILIEMALGFLSKNNLVSDNIHKHHWIVSASHRTLGYFLFFMGFNGLVINIKQYYPQMLVPFYIYISGFVILFIMFEVWWRFPDKICKKRITSKLLVPKITAKDVDEYVKSGKKLILVGDNVYDVSSLTVHPGSKILIQKSVGQDISKYFYGSERLIPYFPVYRHSIHAERKLEKLLFAQLHEEIVLKKPINPDLDGIILNDKWKLIHKQKLSKNFFLLTFRSENHLINLNPPSNQTNGKYFRADIDINGNILTRYYTLILSLNKIRKMTEIKINGKNTEDSFHSILDRFNKTYRRSAFARKENGSLTSLNF